MEQIYPRVHVGGDPDYLRVRGKENFSWVRCCKYGVDGHKELLGYTTPGAPAGPNYLFFRKNKHLLALNLLDLDDPNMVPFKCFEVALDFIKERLDDGDRVGIFCNSGRSRGPSTGLAFLRSVGDLPYHFVKSEHIYRTLYPHYSPGMGVRQVIKENWNTLQDMELSNV